MGRPTAGSGARDAGAEVLVLERAGGGGGTSAKSTGQICLSIAEATFFGRRAGRSAAEQEELPP